MSEAGLLFTAFEPSGDALAAELIAALRAREAEAARDAEDGSGGHPRAYPRAYPGAGPIYALGGPRMAAAGATLIERTTDRATMGLSAASQAWTHRRRMRRLEAWLRGQNLAAVIPTDSPAANWAVCKLARRHQPRAKILHLAAPQLWAWGEGRIRKLRRLSDRVLCLLPFEVDWFEHRGMPATFVGHPLFDEPNQLPGRVVQRRQQKEIHESHDRPRSTHGQCPRTPLAHGAAGNPEASASPGALDESGGPGPSESGDTVTRLALLPGSRQAEIDRNWPTMLAVFHGLKGEHPNLRAVVSAGDAARAAQLRALCSASTLPRGVKIVTGQPASVLQWADAALVVSGTATLQCVVHRRPMVVIYRVNQFAWHTLGRWLVRARTFTLPNLLSESLGLSRAVPERVPHFGEVEPLVNAMRPLMVEGEARDQQRAAFEAIHQAYVGRRFAEAARDAVREALASS